MRATLSVERCRANQANPQVQTAHLRFLSKRWQCIDCDQGARAKAGEFNDDDVEVLVKQYQGDLDLGEEAIGQAVPEGMKGEIDIGMDQVPVQEPESQEAIDRMISTLDRPVDTTETPLDQKQCPKCGQFKDREKDFGNKKNNADGKSRECRECLNRTARERRRAWREKLQRKLKDRPAAGQAGPAPEKVEVLVDEGPREPDDTEETGTMEKKPEIAEIAPDQKRCSKCGQVKDREKDFNKNKARADGKNWACRECANRIARERRQVWREKLQRKREAMAAHQPGQPQGVAPTEDSQRTLSLNFEKCPEVLDLLTEAAEDEMRTPEQQAVWILREILEKAAHA